MLPKQLNATVQGPDPPSIVSSDGPALLSGAGRRRRFYPAVCVKEAPRREAVLSLGICPFRPGDDVADTRFAGPSAVNIPGIWNLIVPFKFNRQV